MIAIFAGPLSLVVAAMIATNLLPDFGGVISKLVLVLSEAGITIAFSMAVLGIFLIDAKEKDSIIIALGVARLLLLVWVYAFHWRDGWYYVLDPNGAMPSAIFLPIVSAIQTAALFFPRFASLRL